VLDGVATLRVDNPPVNARGWIDEVVAPGDLLARAVEIAGELSAHSAAAYAATKVQLHLPARATIDAGAETDETVRASWKSDETRGRRGAFLSSLRGS
jgi:enoyl-CoA hydratase